MKLMEKSKAVCYLCLQRCGYSLEKYSRILLTKGFYCLLINGFWLFERLVHLQDRSKVTTALLKIATV